MDIYDYHSAGGKNVILSYVEKLPKAEKQDLGKVLSHARNEGLI